MTTEKTVFFSGEECRIQKLSYKNGVPALQLFTLDGEPYTTATVNVSEEAALLKENETFIKNYSENEGILEVLTKAGIVEPTGKFVLSGFVRIPVVKLLD